MFASMGGIIQLNTFNSCIGGHWLLILFLLGMKV